MKQICSICNRKRLLYFIELQCVSYLKVETIGDAYMAAAGVPFSGEFGFVETTMHWPITHMVAPKEQALDCDACHAAGGRLQGVEGVYIPGRDSLRLLDWAGWTLALLTLLGVVGHGLLRVFFRLRKARPS